MSFWFIGPSKFKAPHTNVRHVARSSLDSRGPGRQALISTLDPTRLRTSDYVDISSRLRHLMKVESASRQGTPVRPYFQYYKHKGVASAFPPRTVGYFYYHQPEDLPSTAGAIRFRIASVNPATFSRGHDLLRPDGVPWEVPLPTISKTRPVLQQLLLRDGLVTESQLRQSAALFPSQRSRAQTLLHHFDQPFSVEFDSANYIQVVCGGHKYPVDIRVFHEQRNGASCAVYPYSGRALVRFEISTLPQHANSRAAVLRVVKMIEPPKLRIHPYDGHLPCPVEGQLVCRGRPRGAVPWSRKLDSPRGNSLRMLLDIEELFKI
ncbi:hypothetical protein B0H19DRAFT_716760 [Mycena capillaripes]|nr:hypothetical protein B0H19DRAFT_716760 [Mycena capillaripes]